MSYYGGTVTVKGRDLITSLIAGDTIEFTRIVVGSGKMPDGVEPIDMETLVNPIAEATSTVPVVENNVLSMVVEYRNDMNGGLKEGFWLNEFGIFAKTENSEEILLYYATLGDSPQPVNAYQDNRYDIRRYPVTIALLIDADVQITYTPGAFITASEAQEIIESLVSEAVSEIAGDVGAAIIKEITIPADGWTWDESGDVGMGDMDDYRMYKDVAVTEATEEMFPNVALHKDALETAKRAGLCPSIQTLDGSIRFWAKNQPYADMDATLALLSSSGTGTGGGGSGSTYVLPVATETTLGGVKIGEGLTVTPDGTASVEGVPIAEGEKATVEATNAVLDEVYDNAEQEP